MKRATAVVSGIVQGVGYRDYVSHAARKNKILGQVENLRTRDVQIVAEGEEENLKKFLDAINIQNYPVDVENIDVKWETASGEYDYFDIIRGDWKEELSERMDFAGNLLYRSVELGEKNLTLGERAVELSEKNLTLGERAVELSEKNLTLGKRAVELSEESLSDGKKMLDKQDQMLNLQRDTNSEISGLRKDTKSYLDTRFSELQLELTEIKSAPNRAGIKI